MKIDICYGLHWKMNLTKSDFINAFYVLYMGKSVNIFTYRIQNVISGLSQYITITYTALLIL